MMELHVVGFILLWLQTASAVYWIVSNKPVIYGDNIILTCKTEHVLTDRVECPVRQWYRGHGHKDNILLYNKVSRDVTKYEDRTNLSSTEFSLVIKNYTESDLNINYTCSCGSAYYIKLLGLNDFIVPPLRVDTHIQQSNEMLSIYIHVERVYPYPELSIAIGERTVFDNLIFTSVKSGIFFNATYEGSFNIVADDCGKKPTLLCYIGNEYNIVNTSGEPIRNCTDAYTTDMLKNTWTVALSVVVLVCLLIGGVIFYKRKSIQKRILTMKTKTNDTINSDVDQNHIML